MTGLTYEKLLEAKVLLEEQYSEFFMGMQVDNAKEAKKTWNNNLEAMIKACPDQAHELEGWRQ